MNIQFSGNNFQQPVQFGAKDSKSSDKDPLVAFLEGDAGQPLAEDPLVAFLEGVDKSSTKGASQQPVKFAGQKEVDDAVRGYQRSQSLAPKLGRIEGFDFTGATPWLDDRDIFTSPKEPKIYDLKNKPLDPDPLSRMYRNENDNDLRSVIERAADSDAEVRRFGEQLANHAKLQELRKLQEALKKADKEGVDALSVLEAEQIAQAVSSGEFTSMAELEAKIEALREPNRGLFATLDQLPKLLTRKLKPVLSPAQQVVKAVLENTDDPAEGGISQMKKIIPLDTTGALEKKKIFDPLNKSDLKW